MRKVISLSVLSIIVVLFSIGLVEVKSEKISKNTYVEQVDIGGLTKKQAEDKLNEKYNDKSFDLNYADKDWTINQDEIDTTYEIKEVVNKAYNYNKDKNIFTNVFLSLKSKFGKATNFDLVVNTNEGKLKEKIKEIAKEVDRKVEDASISFENGNIEVEPEKTGLKVDIDKTASEFMKKIQQGDNSQELIVTKYEPAVLSEDLHNVNQLLATYTTKLKDTNEGRVENIKIACERTNNILLMPGEEFSFNKHTKYRTAKNGYKVATVLNNGEAVQGLGGGICQVSTTLLNSVLYSGLDIEERRNHSKPSSYVGIGRDATVTDSGIDFVFKNNYKNPVYIRSYYHNEKVTCEIFGVESDKQNIKIVTEIDSKTQPKAEYRNDISLEVGRQKVLENGRSAIAASTYLIYYDKDGKEINRKKVYSSYYIGKPAVIAKGIKKPSTSNVQNGSSNNKQDNDKEDDYNNSNGIDTDNSDNNGNIDTDNNINDGDINNGPQDNYDENLEN